jgi:hypothetical protein
VSMSTSLLAHANDDLSSSLQACAGDAKTTGYVEVLLPADYVDRVMYASLLVS